MTTQPTHRAPAALHEAIATQPAQGVNACPGRPRVARRGKASSLPQVMLLAGLTLSAVAATLGGAVQANAASTPTITSFTPGNEYVRVGQSVNVSATPNNAEPAHAAPRRANIGDAVPAASTKAPAQNTKESR